MKTYQDLLKVGKDDLCNFVRATIEEHKMSVLYRDAVDASMYYKHMNPTIMRVQKWIHNALGEIIKDNWTANNKVPSNYYSYFVKQLTLYLLGNGVTFSQDGTKERLGFDFDYQVQKACTYAQNGGVSFAFWNLNKIEVFSVTEFAPLYNEETGGLMAGVRFWQLADDKPLRATLYELDGYTEYMSKEDRTGELVEIAEKRPYKLNVETSGIDGMQILNGENYPTFPIVPLFNEGRQSEIVGGRSTIDAYDLMLSQLVNNIDDGNVIYWVMKNMDGMDEVDDAKFIEDLKKTHIAHTYGGSDAELEAHTVDVPFQASETALERLRKQLFEDFMALDVSSIQGGNVTATQIKASYEPLNQKADLMEHELFIFIMGILKLAGIEDVPTFNRSKIMNQLEETQMVLSAASYLDDETILKKLPFLSEDEVQIVLDRRAGEEIDRYTSGNDEEEEEE